MSWVDRLTILAAVGTIAATAGAGTCSAQEAVARLIPVESGRIDAGSEVAGREMCLRPSLYVLAFERHTGTAEGYATVVAYETATRRREEIVGMTSTPADQDRWSWRSFTITDYTCLRIAAHNGRARVYQLRVGIDW